MSRVRQNSSPAEDLGCVFEESPQGTFIRIDALKETSVPGVFARGDAARESHSVSLAVGDGALAGQSVHRSLVFG
jgi:thioredoxin reductase